MWNPINKSRRKAQVYVGAYDSFDTAVRAHDIACIALKGPDNCVLNAEISTYEKDLRFVSVIGTAECLRLLRNGQYDANLAAYIEDTTAWLCGRDTRVDDDAVVV